MDGLCLQKGCSDIPQAHGLCKKHYGVLYRLINKEKVLEHQNTITRLQEAQNSNERMLKEMHGTIQEMAANVGGILEIVSQLSERWTRSQLDFGNLLGLQEEIPQYQSADGNEQSDMETLHGFSDLLYSPGNEQRF